MSLDPELSEIILTAIRDGLARVQTSLPAIVTEYDADTQNCSCQIAVYSSQQIPVLEDIPVVFPSGGGYALRFPLSAGDEGTLIFHKLDTSNFLATGQPGQAASERQHGYWAEFHPGNRSDSKTWSDAPTNTIKIGQPGGNEIEITSGEIHLGGNSDFVAMAAKVDAQFQKIVTLFAGWTPVAMDGGAALKTASETLSFDETASTKAKSD